MKTITVKIDETTFHEMDQIVEETNLSRNRYINDALR